MSSPSLAKKATRGRCSGDAWDVALVRKGTCCPIGSMTPHVASKRAVVGETDADGVLTQLYSHRSCVGKDAQKRESEAFYHLSGAARRSEPPASRMENLWLRLSAPIRR